MTLHQVTVMYTPMFGRGSPEVPKATGPLGLLSRSEDNRTERGREEKRRDCCVAVSISPACAQVWAIAATSVWRRSVLSCRFNRSIASFSRQALSGALRQSSHEGAPSFWAMLSRSNSLHDLSADLAAAVCVGVNIDVPAASLHLQLGGSNPLAPATFFLFI
jgi:hypothetical protein